MKAFFGAAAAKVDAVTPANERPLRINGKWLNSVQLTLVLPRGRRISKTFRARPGASFTEKGVEQLLNNFAEQLEKDFPDVDFRIVELRPDWFNVIHPQAEKAADVKRHLA
jgi:hypothetical protein